jgi:hypothetical protein
LNRQEVFASGLDPLLLLQGLALRTVPVPAGVVGYIHMTAAIFIPVPAKGCCPAYLNSTHSTHMMKWHRVGSSIVLTVQTEDIRHLNTMRCPHRRYREKLYNSSGIISSGLVTCARFILLT